MGNSLPVAPPAGGGRSDRHGVVAGPFVGDPVTALEVCTAGAVRGDVLVGRAKGFLDMYSARALAQGWHRRAAAPQERQPMPDATPPPRGAAPAERAARVHAHFLAQPGLPRTDGAGDDFRSGYAALPVVRDSNARAIKGAYSDGRRVYAACGSLGVRAVPLLVERNENRLKGGFYGAGGSIGGSAEAGGPRFEYDLYPFNVRDVYALRSSTHVLHHRAEFLCLAAERDGLVVDARDGTEYDVEQPYGESSRRMSESYEVEAPMGLQVRKRDIPVFFDGRRIVFMTTRSDSENPVYKTRTVTVYDGWGGPYARARRRRARQAAAAAGGEEKTTDAAAADVRIDIADTDGEGAGGAAPSKKHDDGDDDADGGDGDGDGESESDVDVDVTADLSVVAVFEFEMPPRRVIWGFQCSETHLATVHGDRTIKLWNLFADRDGETVPVGDDAQDLEPAFVLRQPARVFGFDFTRGGDLVTVCSGSVACLWRNGTLCKHVRLPSYSVDTWASSAGLYWVKYRCGILAYNDDHYVYAARLEEDAGGEEWDEEGLEEQVWDDGEEEEEEGDGDGEEEVVGESGKEEEEDAGEHEELEEKAGGGKQEAVEEEVPTVEADPDAEAGAKPEKNAGAE